MAWFHDIWMVHTYHIQYIYKSISYIYHIQKTRSFPRINQPTEKKVGLKEKTQTKMCFAEKNPGEIYLLGSLQGGPLSVINGVITPISRVITPVTHLFSAI